VAFLQQREHLLHRADVLRDVFGFRWAWRRLNSGTISAFRNAVWKGFAMFIASQAN
jgi:hypothetical protein